MIISPFLSPGRWVSPKERRSKHRNSKQTKGRIRMAAHKSNKDYQGKYENE